MLIIFCQKQQFDRRFTNRIYSIIESKICGRYKVVDFEEIPTWLDHGYFFYSIEIEKEDSEKVRACFDNQEGNLIEQSNDFNIKFGEIFTQKKEHTLVLNKNYSAAFLYVTRYNGKEFPEEEYYYFLNENHLVVFISSAD